MSKTMIMDHPLVQHKVSLLRNKNTGTKEFKELVCELATLLCYEATRDLPTEEVEIETPIAVAKTRMLSGRKLALVPILRAGLGMVDGILKGLGEQLSSFRYTALDSVVRIALIYLLLPRFGMQGFLFVMLVSNLLTSLLNLHRLLHVTGLRVQWLRWVIKPVFSFLCAGAACRFVLQPLTQRLGLPLLAWAVLGAVFTSVVYALFIWLTGCAGPGDFIVRRTRKKAGERDSSV